MWARKAHRAPEVAPLDQHASVAVSLTPHRQGRVQHLVRAQVRHQITFHTVKEECRRVREVKLHNTGQVEDLSQPLG